MQMEPFKIHFEQSVLDDLQHRLAQTRWPDEITGAGWDYGTNLIYLKSLVDYWQSQFDWLVQEQILNNFNHYLTTIDGSRIHFIYEKAKSSSSGSIPLVLTHGWPGTFYEMLKIIPFLNNPANYGTDEKDGFDVIVPSLPGYGFSAPLTRGGSWDVAEKWVQLMKGLGYDRFAAYGSDWGADVTTNLARYFPQHLIGIFLTTTDIAWPEPIPEASGLSQAEKDFLVRWEKRWQEDGGYKHLQRTKPQTLAYALNDSPVGLAGWIVEKLRNWSDCDGNVEKRFSKDEILTLVMIYWVTQTINSSMRDYYERWNHPQPKGRRLTIGVPAAVAMFTKDFVFPKEWAERSYTNLQYWIEVTQGGHFPALEEPALLAQHLRKFFRALR